MSRMSQGIASLETFVVNHVNLANEIQRKIRSGAEVEMKITKYTEVRREFNINMVALLVGADFVPTKGGDWKLKGTHSLPNKLELAKMIQLAEKFYSVESFYISLEENYSAADSMECIPVIPPSNDIVDIASMNNKSFDELMWALTWKRLSISDFMNIATLGEQQRSKMWNKIFIWSGVAVTLVGGFFIARAWNSNKDNPVESSTTYDLDVDDYGDDEEYEIDLGEDGLPTSVIE